MGSVRPREIHTYRPNRWTRVAVGVALLIFTAVTVIAFQTELKRFYLVVSVLMTVLTVVALIEVFVSRIDLEPGIVVVKGLFRTQRISLADVQKVSAEGGCTALLMKTGKWKKLPEWLGSNMSVRRRIADQLAS